MFTGLTLPASDVHPHLERPADAAWIASRIGQSLGCQHRITRHLASGGMAHVFVVEHVQLGTYAVAKIARPDRPSAAASLAQEAALLAGIDHPNIVKLIEFAPASHDSGYLLLEYVDGIELNSWLRCAGALPVPQGLSLLQQLAAALDHLHACGVVHSDVKPSNVLFDPRRPEAPSVKLIDFGVAFLDTSHGQKREFSGTVAYMAPEQAGGHHGHPAIDIYGLTALAYEVLTGHLICEYPTRQAALLAALNARSGLTQSFWPAGLRAALNTGLEDAPEARFQTAGELVNELTHALRERSGT